MNHLWMAQAIHKEAPGSRLMEKSYGLGESLFLTEHLNQITVLSWDVAKSGGSWGMGSGSWLVVTVEQKHCAWQKNLQLSMLAFVQSLFGSCKCSQRRSRTRGEDGEVRTNRWICWINGFGFVSDCYLKVFQPEHLPSLTLAMVPHQFLLLPLRQNQWSSQLESKPDSGIEWA